MTNKLQQIFDAITIDKSVLLTEFSESVVAELSTKLKLAIQKEITRAHDESMFFVNHGSLDAFTAELLREYPATLQKIYAQLIANQYGLAASQSISRGANAESIKNFKFNQLKSIPKLYDSLKLRRFVGLQPLAGPTGLGYFYSYPKTSSISINAMTLEAKSRKCKTVIEMIGEFGLGKPADISSININSDEGVVACQTSLSKTNSYNGDYLLADAIPKIAQELDSEIANTILFSIPTLHMLTPDSNGVVDIEKEVGDYNNYLVSPRGKVNNIIVSPSVYNEHKKYLRSLDADIVVYDWTPEQLQRATCKDYIVFAFCGNTEVDRGIIFAPYTTLMDCGPICLDEAYYTSIMTRYDIKMHVNADMYFKVLCIPN